MKAESVIIIISLCFLSIIKVWSQQIIPFEIIFDTQIKFGEIKEMIETVDKNGDGKISYSEFRVMMGAVPLVMNWGSSINVVNNLNKIFWHNSFIVLQSE